MQAADERPSARADLAAALAWVALGLAIAAGALAMDRLERQGATLYTMPGLVPGLLGAVIAFLGALLGARALRRGALGAGQPSLLPRWNARLLAALGLMLLYALVLVGRGVPFWLGTFLFVGAFVALFEWRLRGERGQRLRGLAMAALYGASTSAVVSLVFERLFYVRLP